MNKFIIMLAFLSFSVASFAAKDGVNLINSKGASLGSISCENGGSILKDLKDKIKEKGVKEVNITNDAFEIVYNEIDGYGYSDAIQKNTGCIFTSNF